MARARSLAEFQKSFPDEESCAAFLFRQRWPDGLVCPGCGKRRVDTYLNEFVFRYNRRFYRHVSFEGLLGLATKHEPTGYWDIIKRDNPHKRARQSPAQQLLHIDHPESTG